MLQVVFKLGQESPGSYNGEPYSVNYDEKNGALDGVIKYTNPKKCVHIIYKMDGQNLMKVSTVIDYFKACNLNVIL